MNTNALTPHPLFAIGQEVFIVPAGGGPSIASFTVVRITARQYLAGWWAYSYHGRGIVADQEHLAASGACPVIGRER